MFTLLVLISVSSFTQTLENLDYISSFNDDVAAIKKDSQWAFINKDGDITVHPRGEVRVYAQSLIVLVKSDQVPTQADVTEAFQNAFQKFAVESQNPA